MSLLMRQGKSSPNHIDTVYRGVDYGSTWRQVVISTQWPLCHHEYPPVTTAYDVTWLPEPRIEHRFLGRLIHSLITTSTKIAYVFLFEPYLQKLHKVNARGEIIGSCSTPTYCTPDYRHRRHNTNSFIHSVFCLTTGPKPPPKRFLHIVRSRASSFKW
jgi:hypothetical protein